MEDLSLFCCLCIEVSVNLTPLKESDSQDVKLSDKLKQCEPKQDWSKDPLFICNPCKEDLNYAYNFVQKCQKSEQLRREKLQELEKLKLEESQPEVLTCDICKKNFKHKRFLKLHITRIHKVKEIEIDKAKETGSLNNDPIIESKNIHDNKESIYNFNENGIKNPDFEDNFDANQEETHQTDNDEDFQHTKVEEEPKTRKKKDLIKRKRGPHTCEFCGKIFKRRQHWAAHVRANHTFEKIYKCEIENCKASFINSHSLLVHTRNHNNEKPYICSVCGKCFVCSGDLYHHSKIHENKREYQCEICHKRFNTTSILRTHKIVTHTDPKEWRYVCAVCDRRFPINSGLVTHMKRHAGEKNFGCMMCEKKFFNKAEVTKHLLSHSSERLFKCTHCDEKKYKNREGLRKHLKIVHDIGNWKPSKLDKKFYCSFCPKVFNVNNKLQRHLFTHTGEKPFDCQYCQKKFIDKYARRVHLRKEHNVDEADEKTFVIPTNVAMFQPL